MAVPYTRRRVGSIVHAKACFVTADAGSGRRYGSNGKSKLIVGTVVAVGSNCSKLRRQYLVKILLKVIFLTILVVSWTQNYESIQGLVVVDNTKNESSSVEVSVTTERKFDWSQVKSRLCRNGVPNTSLGETLFSLARKVLNSDYSTVEDVHNKKMVDTFYTGFFGAVGKTNIYLYMSQEGGNESMIYIPVWKCANNFIREWLQKRFKRVVVIRPEMVLSFLQARGRATTPCVVTAIRDPIFHFLSGYNEMEHRVWRHIVHPVSRPPPFYLERSFETENNRRQRFKEFVSNVLYDGFDKFGGLELEHVFPPSRILSGLSKLGLQLTTYLPSLVNLTSTWPHFLANAYPGLPSLQDTPDPASMGMHGSSLDEMGFYRAAKDVWAEQGDAARALCILHSFDYACWDDLPDGIPELCQDMYSEETFVDAIMNS